MRDVQSGMDSKDGHTGGKRWPGFAAFFLAQACVLLLLILGPLSPARLPLIIAISVLLAFAGIWLAWITFGPVAKQMIAEERAAEEKKSQGS